MTLTASGIQMYIISAIFIIIATIFRKWNKEDEYTIKHCIRTKAKIESVISKGNCNVEYVVSFIEDGEIVETDTYVYSSSKNDPNIGEEVDIGYFRTKGGNIRAMLFIDGVDPCGYSSDVVYKITFGIGFALFMLSTITMINW